MSLTRHSDLARGTVFTQSIPPETYTADKTGSEIDLSGGVVGDVVVVVVEAGALTNASAANFMTFTVTQSDETGGSFTAAASTQYDPVAPSGSSTAWDRILNLTAENSTSYRFNFRLARTYDFIKVVATEDGTFDDIFSASVYWTPKEQPATGDA